MRGGGGAGKDLDCHIPIMKNDFFKTPFRIIHLLRKCAHSLGYVLCTRDIVLEMTLYMTK